MKFEFGGWDNEGKQIFFILDTEEINLEELLMCLNAQYPI